MNDVSATSMSWYWLSGHDDADLAIYDGNGIRQSTCREACCFCLRKAPSRARGVPKEGGACESL